MQTLLSFNLISLLPLFIEGPLIPFTVLLQLVNVSIDLSFDELGQEISLLFVLPRWKYVSVAVDSVGDSLGSVISVDVSVHIGISFNFDSHCHQRLLFVVLPLRLHSRLRL